MKKVYELCPYCNQEVVLFNPKKHTLQECPSCKQKIMPCSLCKEQDYHNCHVCNKKEE